MKKINIIGTSGSGKSTIGKQVAAALGYPYIEIDAVFWGKNWQETPDDVFFPKLKQALHGECWVLDGNYTRTIPIKWEDVDTVIWIDYSLVRTVFQAIRRALHRVISQQELWPGTGNRESLSMLFSSQSIVLWTLRNFRKNRIRYARMMEAPEYQDIRFVRLRSPKDCRAFLEDLRNNSSSPFL